MPLVNVDNRATGTHVLTFTPTGTLMDTVAVGDIVVVSTSGNWVVESHGTSGNLSSCPHGQVTAVAKDTHTVAVRMLNVVAVGTAEYSTVPTRGLSVMVALSNAKQLVKGSTADTRTIVVALDTPASGQCQWLSWS